MGYNPGYPEAGLTRYTHTHTHIYVYTHIYMFIYMYGLLFYFAGARRQGGRHHRFGRKDARERARGCRGHEVRPRVFMTIMITI